MILRLQLSLLLLAAAVAPKLANAQATFPVDFKIGVHTASTKRNTSLSDVIDSRATASVRGVDAILSSPDGEAGIGGRLLQATYPDGDFTLQEVMLFVGQQSFHLEGGYGKRSLFATDSTETFARAGAKAMIDIGGSGVALDARGSAYFPGDFKKQKATTAGGKDPSSILGWEGETNIYYTLSRIPIYFQLGYRLHYFKFGERAEDMHGVVLGTGLWLGGR